MPRDINSSPGPIHAPNRAYALRTRSVGARQCRRKFLRIFPRGFRDPTYIDWERDYKLQAHRRWKAALAPERYRSLLGRKEFHEIARLATTIESRTNLLFSFEKLALRDALRSPQGARLFALGLFEMLHGEGSGETRFIAWCNTIAALPRRLSRVLTWPVVTVFPFIAQPNAHLYLKPTVTRIAADAYEQEFDYRPSPNWATYCSLLAFGRAVRRDLRDLHPRDQIDIQSFIWVQGSAEYD